MSVNYDLYETPDLTKSGEEQPLHARVVLKGSYTAYASCASGRCHRSYLERTKTFAFEGIFR